jgi:hypothetical protein
MSNVACFLSTTQLFEIISKVIGSLDGKIIFRRYKSSVTPSTVDVYSVSDDLVGIYLDGGYSEIYLSLDKIPVGEKDWAFFDVAADELIGISGGRSLDGTLELTKIRIISKQSKSKVVFKNIKKEIDLICDKGRASLSSVLYPKIHYSAEALEYQLFGILSDKNTVYQIA